ncbi:beta-ketoacyl synthase chain length factor [Marinobacterium lutimaris]|uniref:Beta-ketoacyl synthase, N-terminal domain n=1 Tax=Marinobacterium lutimaris TaxID=568106 RepID=A0A1H5TAM2_9GAMM|nr:beta-ketoacyl synthase chain length factor [Marinobacterium lutimaris]SEF59804.1 Beta-ketoacyl synthase, N-terminal domain [Marinobacterium lutimaris]
MLNFGLKSWSLVSEDTLHWRSHDDTGTASVDSVSSLPAMLRRRLSPFGRHVVATALKILPEGISVPVVYASRHGDAEKTLKLLLSLSSEEPLSPTSFSLSVHNAIPGIFSIARRDVSSVTALACSGNLLQSVLLEAGAQLADYPSVLCMFGDAPVPEFYQYADGPSQTWAVALLLERSQDTLASLQLTRTAADCGSVQNTQNIVGSLLPFLEGHDKQVVLSNGDYPWVLRGLGV